MKTRIRVLAALLALFTLSATVAEGGWAAGCDRMDGNSTAAHAEHAEHAATSTIHDGSDAADPSPLPNPPCSGGAALGCAPLFVTARFVVAALESPTEARITGGPDTTVDLLPIPPPLRPPSL